jgi:hypothetical protein
MVSFLCRQERLRRNDRSKDAKEDQSLMNRRKKSWIGHRMDLRNKTFLLMCQLILFGAMMGNEPYMRFRHQFLF